MGKFTRRGFLKSASLGGVTIGIMATAPALGGVLSKAEAAELDGHGAAHGPLVAYIGNPQKDEIHLLVGTHKIVVRDRALVSKLVRAAR